MDKTSFEYIDDDYSDNIDVLENLISLFLPQFFGSKKVWAKYIPAFHPNEVYFFDYDRQIFCRKRKVADHNDWPNS